MIKSFPLLGTIINQFLDFLTLKDGSDMFPELSVRHSHSTLRNVPEGHRSLRRTGRMNLPDSYSSSRSYALVSLSADRVKHAVGETKLQS